MSLSAIAICMGMLAIMAGVIAVVKTDLVKRHIELFPRSVVPAWILMVICCVLGAKYTSQMNLGILAVIKPYIGLISIGVFVISVIYMKELLAPRALGGALLFIAVPIVDAAKWDDSPWRLVIISIVYIWIVFGIILVMSPWYYRKWCAPLLRNDKLLTYGAYAKIAMGILVVGLGFFVF